MAGTVKMYASQSHKRYTITKTMRVAGKKGTGTKKVTVGPHNRRRNGKVYRVSGYTYTKKVTRA